MAPGSLIGFFLVFVLVTWALSAMATAVLWRMRSALKAWGPAAEKRAAALATASPVLMGALVTVAITVYSGVPELFGGGDHCDVHGHHLHLCLFHGGEWAHEIWAVVASAAILALFVVRGAHLASTVLSGRGRIRILGRTTKAVRHEGITVHVAPAQKDFCFAAGYLRPRIFVSSSLWHRLDVSQRAAMVAHELTHIANHDLWQSLLLSMSEVFGAPFITSYSRAHWNRATERLCDRVAAERVGDAATVAEALLSWARGPRLDAVMSFSPGADALEERVVAVLSDQPPGQGAASRIACFAGVLFAGVTTLVIALADPLHHWLETLFGLGAGMY